ncbi:MAG: LysR family transcriptional regulator [Oscillospiraceae bacterium]|nr:LysR family transcriptional regulator [Oscillospiraceae bacterium]
MVSIGQLETFISVAEEGSFSKAAQKLYLSQPTVSAHIISLENELGKRLFVRTSRGIALTKDGETFYARAKEILKRVENAVAEIQGTGSRSRGSLEIAASSTPAQFLLPDLLAVFLKRHPDVFVSVSACDSVEVARRVMAMECDVGISGASFPGIGCEVTPFLEDELVLVAPDREPFSSMGDAFNIGMLKSMPFVARRTGSGTRKLYESFLVAKGIDPGRMNIVCEMDSAEAVQRTVRSGIGVSLLSRTALRQTNARQGLKLFFLHDDLLRRQFWLVWRKTDHIPAAVEAFLSLAREMSAEESSDGKEETESGSA